MRIPAIAAVLAVAIALAAPSPTHADETAPPDLSGTWVLDKQASDDPAQVMQQSRGSGGGGGGQRGGGGGGGGGRRGGGGGGGRNAGMEGEDALAQDAPRPDAAQALRLQKRIERMEILTAGGEFNVTDGLDISRMLHTDGREETVWTERGEAKASAQWRERTLEVTWSGERGPARTTRFELGAGGDQLIVLEQVMQKGEKKPVTLRLVYRRES